MSNINPRSYADELRVKSLEWFENYKPPEFNDWKRSHLSYVLFDDDHTTKTNFNKEFLLPPEIEKIHNLVMAFFYLKQASETIIQCEYYFRRFPFPDLPVSRSDHLRNMCEFYFNMTYVGHERIKVALSKLNEACTNLRIDFKRTLKQYKKRFEQELTNRHSITHDSIPFDDKGIDKVMIMDLHSSSSDHKDNIWKSESAVTYRREAKKWAKRVKRQGLAMNEFIEAIAEVILKHADFSTPDGIADNG
jgi:hypothetical protein